MNTKLPGCVDVVVIGGGIVGCSTAYYLSRSGVSVAICEKGEIACEQSSRNWGFIRVQGRHPSEIPLMVHSTALWHELANSLDQDIGFHVGGTIYLSETEKRYQANLSWLERTKSFDLGSVYLTRAELSDMIPDIQGQPRGALYTASDARAEPGLATRAIASLATQEGAHVLERCAVRGIDVAAGKVAGVITEHGRIRANAVVCAGGAWSGYFCRHLDIVFPHLKVVSSVMSTEPAPLVAQQNIWSSGLGLRRRMDGGYNVAFGGASHCEVTPSLFRFFADYLPAYRTSKESVSIRPGTRFFKELRWPSKWSVNQDTPFEQERVLDPKPDENLLARAYSLLGTTFPTLKNVQISKRWAGMIDVTPDELPVISLVESVPGLVISTGYSGHGFGIGPGAGHVTAALAKGDDPAVDLSPFSIKRLLK